MEVTKEKVLESMNAYCTERKYGSETLADGFKEKFSNFFVKKYEGKDVEEEDMVSDLRFNLDTAFNAAVDTKTTYTNQFATKENDYKKQIAELNKKLGKQGEGNDDEGNHQQMVIPKELQDQLDELKQFKNEKALESKFNEVLEIAQKDIRQDLQSSFKKFAKGCEVSLDKEAKEQADALVERFQEVFRDSIGDVKPLAPKVTQKRDDEMMASVPEVKVQ